MLEWRSLSVLAIGAMMLLTPSARGKSDIERLKPAAKFAAFKVENIYENEKGKGLGARFRHIPSGFVLDLLRIQSVPQAFMWVNSFPPSDQGEPHTCEHLMLGKGTQGRYVASLEQMLLGKSSAFTGQLQTCYHFHTAAGSEAFFQLMEAKLEAFVHPNFSDEEIRREICNIGYQINPPDSSIRLEEKGTVYAEMVSSFERPWAVLDRQMSLMLYGPGHPLSNESGGFPDSIRNMVSDDMRRFIDKNYHLSNMGMIVAIPDDIGLDVFLKRASAILERVEPDARPGSDPATADEHLPQPQSALAGAIKLVDFPSQNDKEPGLLVFAWPPTLDYDNNEGYLLDLLTSNLASGETSDLYRKFIDSQTRLMDIGANSVFGWISDEQGHAIYLGFGNVKQDAINEATIDSIRSIILGEIKQLASLPDSSAELLAFNERAKGRVIEYRRDLRNFFDSPPGFGFRGASGRWLDHVKHLQKVPGFRKRLSNDDELRFAEQNLSSGKNFWKGYIEKWKLVESIPYAVATVPNPDMIHQAEQARDARVEAFVKQLMKQYGTDNRAEALKRFKGEYDARTAEIDSVADAIPMPKFVDNPPLTLDDQLRYKVEKLPGGRPLVVSTFDNMVGSAVGLAFRMDVVPESLLLYTGALPILLTEVGVIKDGKPLRYDEMKEAIRREITGINAYYSVNYRTERVELVIRALGSARSDTPDVMSWLTAVLFDADWRTENLPRLRDAIDLSLGDLRNVMRGSEEAWVNDPVYAYWRQTNPLIMNTESFLTQTHALHRMRWRLKDAGSPEAADQFSRLMAKTAALAEKHGRIELSEILDVIAGNQALPDSASPDMKELAGQFVSLSDPTESLIREAARDLKLFLPDIPDATMGDDWRYLCTQMDADLRVPPEKTLADLKQVMDLIRRKDNARAFIVGNSSAQKAIKPRLDKIVSRLSSDPSRRQTYPNTPRIISRLQERTPGLVRPVFVGLINDNTRSGVVLNSVPCASYMDSDPEKLLRFLSAKLYGGGGANSMFMKTWSAGLAYSNGLRSNESTGRLVYYGERCPDLAQTVQFVVNELRNAPRDTSLAEYAVAQAFAIYRSGSRYETRGEAIAADLADGVTPDIVRRFRKAILELRKMPDLYDQLRSRMEPTYGQVLPGSGPRLEMVQDAVYFIIGPESQFQSYEKHVRSVEGGLTVYRLYPRDYWITR